MATPQASHRPELADTLPDLRSRSGTYPRAAQITTLSRLKQDAKPFLIGAGVGVGLGIAVAALTHQPKNPTFALFPEPRSTLFKRLGKLALLAVGRTLLRRALARAAEHALQKAAMSPA